MPSDKCNSITAKATGLILSLFNVASAEYLPFGIPHEVHAMHSSWTYQCPPTYMSHSSLLTAKRVDLASVIGFSNIWLLSSLCKENIPGH